MEAHFSFWFRPQSLSRSVFTQPRPSAGISVRVDLYYRSEAQARLRVEHIFDDLNRLIAERGRNLIFDHETGYICSVEQGEDRGYHIHAAFFFNGAEVSADIYRAQRIGELLERITRGQSYCNNCNLGILATIHSDTPVTRLGAMATLFPQFRTEFA